MGHGAGSQRSGTIRSLKTAERRWTSAVRRYLYSARVTLSERIVKVKAKAARSRFLRYKFWSRRFNVYLDFHGQDPIPWSQSLDTRVGAIGTKSVPLRVYLTADEEWCRLPANEQAAVPSGWPSLTRRRTDSVAAWRQAAPCLPESQT